MEVMHCCSCTCQDGLKSDIQTLSSAAPAWRFFSTFCFRHYSMSINTGINNLNPHILFWQLMWSSVVQNNAFWMFPDLKSEDIFRNWQYLTIGKKMKEGRFSNLLLMIHLCISINRVLSQSSNQIYFSSLSFCFDRRLNLGLNVGWPPLRACEQVTCRGEGHSLPWPTDPERSGLKWLMLHNHPSRQLNETMKDLWTIRSANANASPFQSL